MSKIPYWIRGGIIAVAIYFILTATFFYFLKQSGTTCSEAGCVVYSLPLLILNLPTFIVIRAIGFEGLDGGWKEIACYSAVIYFIGGALLTRFIFRDSTH